MATAKPRSRKSRTVSKYFSICSLRPVKTHTVPLRPAGGAQRAKRSSAPSGVLMVPETTSSGTGLEGIETSVMGKTAIGGKDWKTRGPAVRKRQIIALLNAAERTPYHLRAGRYQCFGKPKPEAAQEDSPARWRAGHCNSRSMEDYSMRTY